MIHTAGSLCCAAETNTTLYYFSCCSVTSHVRLFVIPRTVAHQAALSFTISQSLLRLMSIEWVMPSNHLILCCPLLFLPAISPSVRSLPMSRLFTSGGQSIGASASVLPMNSQDWFPLGLTDWISLQSKWLSRVFSSTTVWKHQFFGNHSNKMFFEKLPLWYLCGWVPEKVPEQSKMCNFRH